MSIGSTCRLSATQLVDLQDNVTFIGAVAANEERLAVVVNSTCIHTPWRASVCLSRLGICRYIRTIGLDRHNFLYIIEHRTHNHVDTVMPGISAARIFVEGTGVTPVLAYFCRRSWKFVHFCKKHPQWAGAAWPPAPSLATPLTSPGGQWAGEFCVVLPSLITMADTKLYVVSAPVPCGLFTLTTSNGGTHLRYKPGRKRPTVLSYGHLQLGSESYTFLSVSLTIVVCES